MIFDNSDIRRKDRTLNEARCLELIRDAEYGVLSICDDTLGVYGIPISYVWDNVSSLYFHCAPEGKKLNIIENNNNASFCIVGKTSVVSNKFTTEYESVVLRGKIYRNLSNEEKMLALTLILDKYSPDDKELGLTYAKKSFNRTEVLRLDIESFSGKSKNLNVI